MQPQLIAGRYQVVRAVGRGGMGIVWLCRDEVLGREVAVKQIGALSGESATQTKRAMREARSAAALNHPNAVAVYDVVDHDGRPWLVMEYVEGQTLADEIARDGQLSPQRVADIGAQLASALARAHERRIIHRDIKPGNVLIDRFGRPKISDFGIARGHGDEQLTQVGFITGTPGFLSPELARGSDPHSASDVWALGATLYSAVEGQMPYLPMSNPIALLRAIATERPRPMRQAGALGPAIDAMMHEDPASRWDMKTSAQQLGRIARGGTITASMPGSTPVDPARTAVMPTSPLEATQSLAATAPLAKPPAVAIPVVKPVVSERVAETTAVKPPVAKPPVAKPIVVQPQVAKPPVATPPVATPPVVTAPVDETRVIEAQPAKLPPAASPVASTRSTETPVAQPSVTETPVAKTSVTETPKASLPVVKPSVTETPPARSPVAIPSHDRRSGRRLLPLLLAVLVLAAFGVAYLLSPLGDPARNTVGNTAGTPAPVTPTKTTASATSTAPEPSPTRAAPTKAAPATGPKADRKLENFVTSYYSDVTNHRDRTWAQLTPKMQRAATGRSGYDGFWSTIDKVKVNQIQADASAETALVNLTFTRNDRTTSTESHRITIVRDGEGYLIDGDRFGG